MSAYVQESKHPRANIICPKSRAAKGQFLLCNSTGLNTEACFE